MNARAKFLPENKSPAISSKKPAKRLRVKAGRNPVHYLPFVNIRAKASARYWHVPATGGYFGGYETGKAMALAFLKELRDERVRGDDYWLTQVVVSFMVRFEEEGGSSLEAGRYQVDENGSAASFRGQYAGFFNTLSQWLTAAAKQLGANLDRIDEHDLVRKANAGLAFDTAALMASLREQNESGGEA